MRRKVANRNHLIRILFAFVIGGFLLLAPAGTRAHAGYERSDPAAESVIPTAPEAVHVWFTQELFRREGENWIVVLAPDGTEAHLGDAQIDDEDRAHMWVELQPDLPAGEFVVRWRTLSADDGDTAEGEFTFTVDPLAPEPTLPPQPTATTAPTQAQAATPTESAMPTEETGASTGLPCLGSALLGILAASAIWRRRN